MEKRIKRKNHNKYPLFTCISFDSRHLNKATKRRGKQQRLVL